MVKILEICNLSYEKFSNINLSFDNKSYYSIIGSNKSGKTTLFKLIAGIIPSNNAICCNNVILNNTTVMKYITNLGIVNRVNKDSFIFQTIIDEMMYPLNNLGYHQKESHKRIKEVLSYFKKEVFLQKKISDLNYYDKQLLLIMIAVLHQPKVLLLDEVLDIFPTYEQKRIISILKKHVKDLTIINFTNTLDDVVNSKKIVLLDNFQVVGEYIPSDIYKNDKFFYEHNLQIPFLIDLSVKLSVYNIVNKNYSSMKEMVDDIWP